MTSYLLVRHAVIVEVGAGGEALATDLALVRLLARVDATVRVERARRRERLAADVTRVRFLTCNKRATDVELHTEKTTYLLLIQPSQDTNVHKS